MKKILSIIGICVFTGMSAYTQETLQTVTDRGNTSTNRVILNPIYQFGSRLTAYGAGSGYFDIYNNANSSISLHLKRSDGTSVFEVDGHSMRSYFNGNVGIGTDDPTNTLTLRRSALGTSNDVGIDFSATNGTYNPVYARIALGIGTALQNQGTGYLSFSTLNFGTLSESMRINSNGDVGIGTTDPKGYKLAIAGNMIAESVKVKLQGAWPDFVFDKSYKLPTLKETEKHIKEKGHLPGIPSAAEVKASGVNLGEMNAKLLEKIEELTLHLIEMEKSNELQKKINQEQNRKFTQEIDQLKSKL